MGEHEEHRLRDEMADWNNDRLIAKTVKSTGLAADIAARQILEDRRAKREAKRFHITVAIGLIGLVLSAVAAWFAWKAIPEVPSILPAARQPPASVPSGIHNIAISPRSKTDEIQRQEIHPKAYGH